MSTAEASDTAVDAVTPRPPPHPHPSTRRRIFWIGGIALLAILVIGATVWLVHAMHFVSTDDAYVNGHVTFVAPRVAGQVESVLVEDNNRVHRGDVLLRLDREPYQVQVNIAQAAVAAAQAGVALAEAQARGIEGQARSLRYSMEHSMEDVDNQIALLQSRVASLKSQQASLSKAQADYDRALPLLKSGAVSQEEMDRRRELLDVARATTDEAMQGVYQVRVELGLPPKPPPGGDLGDVPKDLDQTFSAVRQAQYGVMEAIAQLGVSQSFTQTPREMVETFLRRDPEGNIDRIYAQLLKDAPGVQDARTKLLQAQRDLDQANLSLRYCDVLSDIDGVVTRRNVNPGNNVIAGQTVMAVRSLTDIWIDANFKETQLARLRIGQPAVIDVDMYGSHKLFKGRVSGFTMGTGSTLSLLPAENATGNFVKVVQRLPVRIDLIDYDPEQQPLFVGLSVEPSVNVVEQPTGDSAGKFLQPYVTTPAGVSTQPAVQP